MKQELQIIVAYKLFLSNLQETLECIPRKEKYIKEMFLKEAFGILELLYETNELIDKKMKRNQIVSKISMMDYYLEYFYTRKELSKKITSRKSYELEVILKMVKSWLK